MSDDPLGEVDFAYIVRPAFRNKGYASEALRAMLDYCFAEGIERVWGGCHLDNAASARVMEKAGMVYDHSDDREMKFIAVRGTTATS